MKRKAKTTPYDVVDYLRDEEALEGFIAAMREGGATPVELEYAYEKVRLACARYGLRAPGRLKSNNNMEGTPPLRGEPYPTL
jgi:hypothetical protein